MPPLKTELQLKQEEQILEPSVAECLSPDIVSREPARSMHVNKKELERIMKN